MTLTKYQRGDAIEGWNDMPTNMMLSSSNNSTTSVNSSASSSRSRKRVSRIGMNFNGDNSSNPIIGTSDGTTTSPGPPLSSTPPIATGLVATGPVPIRGPITPTPGLAPPRKSIPSTSQQSSQLSSQPEFNSNITSDQVIQLLEQTLQLPLSLPERELLHYKNKLTQSIPSLISTHLSFLHNILDRLLLAYKEDDTTTKAKIKTDVVEYMMNQEGVSAWCSPLKKIVSSI